MKKQSALKPWKIQAFLKNGPMVLFFSISKTKVKFRASLIRFEFFFNEPESVSGWVLREALMPKSMYRMIAKAVKKADFPLDSALVSCSFSKDGNSIVITVSRRLAEVYSVPVCALSVIDKSQESKSKKNRRKTFSPFRFISP